MKLFIYFSLFTALMSCSENDEDSDSTKGQTPQLASCYTYINQQDTIILKPVLKGKSVTGSLVYHYSEKDRNSGRIKGTLENGMLIADYTFMSEGKKSVRQVVFKKIADGLVEGYGEITETDEGESIFKTVDALDYDDTFLLRPECP